MNKNYKKGFSILLCLVLLIISVSSVFGKIDDAEAWWSFDTSMEDVSGNGNDAINNGASNTQVDCKLNGCYDSPVAGDIKINTTILPTSGSYSISAWCKWDTFTLINQDQCISSWGGFNGGLFMYYDGTNMRARVYQDSGWIMDYIDTTLTAGDWHYMTFTMNHTTKRARYYRDGVLLSAGSVASTWSYAPVAIQLLGMPQNADRGMNGRVDEVGYYLRVLSLDDHIEGYNGGNATNPYAAIPSNASDSTESTALVNQVGSASFSIPTTIVSSNFAVPINNTPLYGGYYFEVETNVNNEIYCELSIDSTVYANITRSNTVGTLGNMFLQTPIIILDNSTNHTQELVCERLSGGGLLTVSNGVGIGHFLVNHNNETLPYNETTFDVDVTSGSSYTLLSSYNITTGNQSSDNQIHSLVVEGMVQYQNNLGSEEQLSVYANIGGTNCSFNLRDVNAGNTGSVSYDCILENVTNSTEYLINIYGNGTQSNYQGNFIVKDLFLSGEEIAGGTGILKGITFNGSTDVRLTNITGGNLNHPLVNVFEKLGYSVLTNIDTDVSFYIKIVDGNNFTSKTFTRGFEAGRVGFIIGHDILENIPVDPTYQVELWANCGDVSATCEIVGGSSLGYVTDVIESIVNSFNVSVFDNFDNTTIDSFSVTLSTGTSFNFTSNTGSISVVNEFITNFSVASIFNGGYFSESVLNHNSSLDYVSYLNQTLIGWDCIEKVSNNNLNCFQPSEATIFNYNVIGNPYIQSVNVSGYFERFINFNVTALQSEVKQATGFYSTNLSLNSSSPVGIVGNCTYNVSGITYPAFFEQVFGDPFGTIGLINGSYSMIADCDGFALSTFNITITETLEGYNFSMFTVNSILFNIFDLSSLNPVLSLINIELLGSVATYNTNTSNGSVYIDGLLDDTYTITLSGTGFSNTVLFATISNNNHLDIDAYMQPVVSEISFIVQDQSRVLLGNATITFTRIINGSEITIGQAKTDFSGRAIMFLNRSIEYGMFVAKDGYDTFTGNVVPTQPEYTIIMQKTGATRFISLFEDLEVQTTFSYVPLSGFALVQLILNSPSGALEYYGMNTTYRGTTYFINTSGIPAGGIELFNITNIDPAIEPTVNIDYWFKYNDRDLTEWSSIYLVSDVVPTNITLTSGLFDDLENVDKDNAIRGVIGALIILAFILIFSFSRDITVTVLGGLLGLFINWKIELMPKELIIVSAIVCCILLIADNIGGRG